MPLNSHNFQSRSLDLSNLSLSSTPLLSRSSTKRSFIPLLSKSQSSDSSHALKLYVSNSRRRVHRFRRRHVQFKAFDDNSFDIPLLDDLGDNEGTQSSVMSSSDGESSDSEFLVNPLTELDLPSTNSTGSSNNDALSLAAHRLGTVGRGHKRYRIKYGAWLNTGLILFLTVLLLYVDWCAWRIVRLPLAPFHLTRPFLISAVLASCAGYICVPLLYGLKMYQIIRKKGPVWHSVKKRTPTMGGLFFVPIGVIVAKLLAGSPSLEVSGAVVTTLAFGAIGLLDDVLVLVKSHSRGLSARIRILLEVAVGVGFSFWLTTASISSPYSMKMLVPLPSPLGLVQVGKWYLMLTSFCLVSMGNGVNLTDGLDGLSAGTSALAFVGMSIAVLPICPGISIFGASMAGACVGFLLHNRYKASVFMGDTGSLALGGALASMAACTGMFFPLFVASGFFVVEVISVIMQVSYYRTTKRLNGVGRRLFRMAPIHHHFELCGFKEPMIVGSAYVISSVLALFAAYLGLISA